VSRLSHPNTVQVFDFGQADGSMYLVMELVRGEDLGAILRRDGPFAWKRLAPILTQVLDALTEAHELGIIHRDVKPENLLVSRTRDGRDLVKVLDFGLAKLRDVEELNAVTGRGTVIGTPYYMSPEQLLGAKEIDHRTDLWSLALVAFHALTGQLPFMGETIAGLAVAIHSTATPLPSHHNPSLSPAIDAWFIKACARDPGARYQTAAEMAAALELAVRGGAPQPVVPPDAASSQAIRALPPASEPNLPLAPTGRLRNDAAAQAGSALGDDRRVQLSAAAAGVPVPFDVGHRTITAMISVRLP